jgi:hypothetical protein
MDELAVHVKAMHKLRLEAKEIGVWQGGDRNFVFHSGTGKSYYHIRLHWCGGVHEVNITESVPLTPVFPSLGWRYC